MYDNRSVRTLKTKYACDRVVPPPPTNNPQPILVPSTHLSVWVRLLCHQGEDGTRVVVRLSLGRRARVLAWNGAQNGTALSEDEPAGGDRQRPVEVRAGADDVLEH